MTKYTDTLSWMYKQLPMYQRQGQSAFKKNLDNIIALCSQLGNPQDKFKSIHVAGTNGKGTVSHLIGFGLQVQGYKVGIYSSPHYKDFRERIKINGDYISKKEVVHFIKENEKAITRIKPSFFEITVAMAFDHFAKSNIDVAVIEVGLGGRLDSTNIINPLLSVITNISLDHTEMLGNTIPEIAREKAGIIKNRIPVVIGETQVETTSVFKKKASDCQSPISWIDQNLSLKSDEVNITLKANGKKVFTTDSNPLKGEFQLINIRTAIGTLLALQEYLTINISDIGRQFGSFRNAVNYMGRWQLIGYTPDILVDSAHNKAGLSYLKKYFDANSNYEHLHIVCGFVNDKDLDSILPLFPISASYYFAKANIPRGLDAKLLAANAKKHGLSGKSYSSVKKALSIAKRKAKKKDLIFIGGSIFVVAEVL